MTATAHAFNVLTSSNTSEWFTPAWAIALVRQLGPIGLDPCSNAIAQQWIQAERYHTKQDDGFICPWKTDKGLWLNCPYGTRGKGNHGASAWILKAIAEYDAGHYPWGVLLVRGDSEGVHALEARFLSCEPRDRIAFVNPTDPTKDNPVPGCRFWYLGTEPDRFAQIFAPIGAVRSPYPFHPDRKHSISGT